MKHIRKPTYIPLLLDSQGRQIDQEGKLVKMEGPVKTLAANVAVGQAKKKKENPYLAHRSHGPAAAKNDTPSSVLSYSAEM